MALRKLDDTRTGESIRLNGVVQGVGMRPTVWRLAQACGLVGEVTNDNLGVNINVWGTQSALDIFKRRLNQELPALCKLESFICSPLSYQQTLSNQQTLPTSFTIGKSDSSAAGQTSISVDVATCNDCLSEMLNPGDRRYRYPFISCTHCGPRFSIVKKVPFDRENTSMNNFALCSQCQEEYQNPKDRRFHAQTNCCSSCGPKLSLEDAKGKHVNVEKGQDLIQRAASLIRSGKIVAIKGIGGIHLACDARNQLAVANLRQRKNRYKKAFALMARNVEMISRYAKMSAQEAELLGTSAAPIVVLRAKTPDNIEYGLAQDIAPGQNTLGFMLPYTPLHHLLMMELDFPIVLTSGNLSDDAQCIDNAQAKESLSEIADYFLLHNRQIDFRLDDSVLRVNNNHRFFIRRARGYAAQAVSLASCARDTKILAMGAELKNTFCLLEKNKAIVSQHFGDLENAPCLQDYRQNLKLYQALYQFSPELIAVDKHPNYLSTKIGKEFAAAENIQLLEVQHHHAHIAACMAEHGITNKQEKVLGVAMDGLGFGEDDTFWGGEFLVTDYTAIERAAHFQSVPMPGGTMAIKQPWRNTFAYLHELGWSDIEKEFPNLELIRFLQEKPISNIKTMLERKLNSPKASSAGRLFDSVAAALGVCRETVSYEGQAAVELETLADTFFIQEETRAYDYHIQNASIYWDAMWYGLLRDLADSISPQLIASRFHHTLINAITEVTSTLCRQRSIGTVALSGGVFQNQLLLEHCSSRLRAQNLQVLIPENLPVNDGGISLGQAVVASHRV